MCVNYAVEIAFLLRYINIPKQSYIYLCLYRVTKKNVSANYWADFDKIGRDRSSPAPASIYVVKIYIIENFIQQKIKSLSN